MNTVQAVSYLLENNLNFRAELSILDAVQVLQNFQPYNDIPEDIEKIVGALCDKIGPVNFGPGNPNNGKFHNIKIFIGNESSLVIYVEIIHSYQVGRDSREYKSILEKIGRKFKADEIGVTQDERKTVARFWWD
jgi:hypothetical protein